MIVIEERNREYGDYGLVLSKYHLNINWGGLGAPKKTTTSSSSIGWLNPSKYHLNINMPNWLKPKPTTSIVPNRPKITVVPPKVQNTSFLSKVKSGLGNLFHSIGNVLGQIAPTIIQYKLAKEQMKMQADLAKLQYQSSLQSLPPTGGVNYPTPNVGYPQGAGYPSGAGIYQRPQNNTGKYLLIGGGILAAVLLFTLMNRD